MTIYTDHAKARMEMRRIKKEWVEEAIGKPEALLGVKYGRKQAVKRIMGEEMSVIYVERGNDRVVITVFWGR